MSEKKLFSRFKKDPANDGGQDLKAAEGAAGKSGKTSKAADASRQMIKPDLISGVRERISSTSRDMKGMFEHVIRPEERTLKNYLKPSFWKDKKTEYDLIREKEKQDLDVYTTLSRGAYPTIEYYVLIVMSCVIATAGLLQGSPAVIIGAMIVAPLMTPILAFSLGVIRGDMTIIKMSAKSIINGVALAIMISSLIAFAIPIPDYSPEIIARTRPNLFDIIVALASGIVGAYGSANSRISGTLVGIAIAVALMPPLCTIGIGIGTLSWGVASGATLLFLINLISISLAGAVVFWLMKIHPVFADTQRVARRAVYQIAISIAILAAISVPVGVFMHRAYRVATAKQTAQRIIAGRHPGVTVMQIHVDGAAGGYVMSMTLSGSVPADQGSIGAVREEIRAALPMLSEIKIHYLRTTEL